MPSDELLMEGLVRGDGACLAELYLRHGSGVRTLVCRLFRDLSPADADDVCQETFLALKADAGRFRAGARLRPWLLGIAVHKARALRAKRWWRARLLRTHLFGRHDPQRSSSLERQIGDREQLERALAALPQPQREVLLLHVTEAQSSAEIATTLGISEKTVWTRLHRARLRMAAALASGAKPEPGGGR